MIFNKAVLPLLYTQIDLALIAPDCGPHIFAAGELTHPTNLCYIVSKVVESIQSHCINKARSTNGVTVGCKMQLPQDQACPRGWISKVFSIHEGQIDLKLELTQWQRLL